jgi:hypothetical protein
MVDSEWGDQGGVATFVHLMVHSEWGNQGGVATFVHLLQGQCKQLYSMFGIKNTQFNLSAMSYLIGVCVFSELALLCRNSTTPTQSLVQREVVMYSTSRQRTYLP